LQLLAAVVELVLMELLILLMAAEVPEDTYLEHLQRKL
jgi:hypothetical protein